jgi:hypothetical protein
MEYRRGRISQEYRRWGVLGLPLERQPRALRLDQTRRRDPPQSRPRTSHPRPDHQIRGTPLALDSRRAHRRVAELGDGSANGVATTPSASTATSQARCRSSIAASSPASPAVSDIRADSASTTARIPLSASRLRTRLSLSSTTPYAVRCAPSVPAAHTGDHRLASNLQVSRPACEGAPAPSQGGSAGSNPVGATTCRTTPPASAHGTARRGSGRVPCSSYGPPVARGDCR